MPFLFLRREVVLYEKGRFCIEGSGLKSRELCLLLSEVR